MIKWVRKFMALFRKDLPHCPEVSTKEDLEVSGAVRQAQQRVQSSAQFIMRQSAANREQAQQIKRHFHEKYGIDSILATADEAIRLISEEGRQEHRTE